MQITIVQGAFLPVPPIRGGAIEKIWKQLGEYFVTKGHSVTHVSRLCDDLPKESTEKGVRHIRVKGADCPRSLLWLKWLDLLYTIRVSRILTESDIVVTNTFWAPVLFNPKRHGKIWVHIARYPKYQFSFYRRASRLQSVSTPIANALADQAPGLASRICMIANPLPYTVPDWNFDQKASGEVLFVGRIHPEKGVDLLIRAVTRLKSRFKHIKCNLVGPWKVDQGGGGSSYLNTLKTLITQIDAPVSITGPIFDEKQLRAYYRSASIFVYPSLAEKGEASPLAPLEAMAEGCPVIVSDMSCFDDAVGEGKHAQRFDFRAKYRERLLSDCIAWWLDNEPARKEASRSANTRAKLFELPRIADQYLAEFESLLGK